MNKISMLKAIIVVLSFYLSACGDREAVDSEPKKMEKAQSIYYDYNDEHKFAPPVFELADSLAVNLCDCVVTQLHDIGYSTKAIIERYDFAMNTVYAVDKSASVFCTYLTKWKDVYDRNELDSLMTNFIFVEDSVAGVKVNALKDEFGILKAFNVVELYENNCKITAPYARMVKLINTEIVLAYLCELKTNELYSCFNIITESLPTWFYDNDVMLNYEQYIQEHCTGR